MQALLKQQGIWGPLSEKKSEAADLETLEEKAFSTILLCLVDEIIIEVSDEKTAASLWQKLESLYMTKSLTNKLLLKQRLFALRMQEDIELRDHLDKLNLILLELRNIDVKVEDEDVALILLVSLPNSFENFVQSFIVGKDTLRLEEVRSALHSRELRHKASSSGTDNQASGLFVSGVKGHGNRRTSRDKKSFPRGPKASDICNYCKEKGHWKSDCPKMKEQRIGSVAVAEDETKFDDDIALVGERPVGASGPHGHLVCKDIWPVGASGLQGHLVRKDIWSVGTSGPLGRLVRWDIWYVGTSGPLGRLVRWDIWSVGTSSPLGYPADDERLALVEHLAVKGRLVRHSNTSGPKGHLRQRER
uniref:CCHC-type domain-containing protein n=1 Tax=Brassica oleracea var. oleracea TaxID=109376 RepID=A0A0D2ZRY6_BRAOL